MGNCPYRLSFHLERAPATRRICAGGDTAGWNEPLRMGFWGGPGNEHEAGDATKAKKLTASLRIGDDQTLLLPTAPSENRYKRRASTGAADRTFPSRASTSSKRKGFWSLQA